MTKCILGHSTNCLAIIGRTDSFCEDCPAATIGKALFLDKEEKRLTANRIVFAKLFDSQPSS